MLAYAGCAPGYGYNARKRACEACSEGTYGLSGRQLLPCQPCACPAPGECATSSCSRTQGCVLVPKDNGTACSTGTCVNGECKGGRVGGLWCACTRALMLTAAWTCVPVQSVIDKRMLCSAGGQYVMDMTALYGHRNCVEYRVTNLTSCSNCTSHSYTLQVTSHVHVQLPPDCTPKEALLSGSCHHQQHCFAVLQPAPAPLAMAGTAPAQPASPARQGPTLQARQQPWRRRAPPATAPTPGSVPPAAATLSMAAAASPKRLMTRHAVLVFATQAAAEVSCSTQCSLKCAWSQNTVCFVVL